MKSYLKGGHVIQEEFFWRTYIRRWICLTGGHVLLEDISYGRDVILENMSYWSHVLRDMPYNRMCLTGVHVLLENVLNLFN